MRLRPAPVPFGQLTYDPAGRRFTGEISSTSGFGRVWDDACDQGLTIVGTTGYELVMVVGAERRDAEGDITAWDLEPADPCPAHLRDLRLTLFND